MNPLLFPVIAAQGLLVRMRTETLTPAGGPTSGTESPAEDEPVRIAVLGESTAAGCGVDSHGKGFTGHFARELGARTGRPVEWAVHGQYGATVRRIRYRLLPEVGPDLQVAALLAGVNDVLGRTSPQGWGDELHAVVKELGQRAEQVVVTGIPAFGEFPSVPGTLGRYLAERATALDDVSQRVCAEFANVTWVGSVDVLPMGPEFFARDRFHPSAHGYREWARIVAGKVAL
ncbi:SGNH/GDSL hydrolase family protein [Streptomyces sp. NBC_00342]|uniref:SGNH/GDSL hydrolase family protein n=1 Tax=Streptomyces sp. NBC_00342 TaxID=2975718 RepID=UPI002E29F91A|nr:SGNH/GDSL hydrolase family protein [Streptomyces sp. NBC_00342]